MMTLLVDPAPVEAPRFEAMRHAMVASQLRTNAVNDPRVVAAMSRIPREAFLPAEHRAIAYRDSLLPLGNGRQHNAPLVLGRLLTESVLQPTDHVLLIGAAGGYGAAVLAQLVQSVIALEEDPSLAAIARGGLAGSANVELVQGPLNAGWAGRAPYDLIVIDGAVEALPQAIIDQVKPGGRIATGVVDRGVTRLALGRRTEGGFGLADFMDIEVARLPGFDKPRKFTF
ncbi:protein-L-isoaspartate O-methyltransferase family protein [Sphingomonas pokkalii]|uniref:Protein-L-isoaspartate O-methyltransferase n=1 Tax=Sphingomonas pokkalii TaxID=2175090 RepID=A0A2U0SIR3_9SPHN|nr:protein-L-isoaspartate O-methyltransferase [Sphingomonas pokkalii]PVX31213.1 protein-L-isoaspartate O-methyltransferase [Sphingomonas pokkalii]